jgi:hypothetical protein
MNARTADLEHAARTARALARALAAALVLALLAPPSAADGPEGGPERGPSGAAAAEPAPRRVSWSALREVFDPACVLPESLALSGEGPWPAVQLAEEWRELANLVAEPSTVDPQAPRCFGDLAREWTRARDAASRAELLERTARAQPRLWARLQPFAAEMLADDALRRGKWTPDDDLADDGCAFAMPLTLEGARAPYADIDGSRLVQQAVVFVRADLAALKTAENDYPAYMRRPGSAYERIHPLRGSLVEGDDEAGRPFQALKVGFKSDLPWPFSHYECDLRVLNRFDERGGFVCDVRAWNDGRDGDFVWLAGRDHYHEVRDARGEWQGTLVVRWFGFDLRGVPDTDSARRAGLRAGLLCLKREAEVLQRAHSGSPRLLMGALPSAPVRGWR